MGTWSTEPFGNDTAGDWGARFVKANDLGFLEATLDVVLEAGTLPFESAAAEEAVAVAEVLAKLRGMETQRDGYTANVDGWVASFSGSLHRDLLDKARRALERIRTGRSLQDQWHDPGGAYAWRQALARLESVLTKSAAQAPGFIHGVERLFMSS